MVTFAPENAPALKFTVSWPLGYEMKNSKVKLTLPEDHVIFDLVMHWSRAVVFGARATTVYPGRDTFQFDQGHVTKNQPITMLVLLSES